MPNEKRCIKCKKMLPISQYYFNKDRPVAVCKSCYINRIKKYENRRLKEEAADVKSINLFKIERKFKELTDKHIHNEVIDELIADDEVFVNIMDCLGYYISNYGRCVRYDGNEHILMDAIDRDGRAYYKIEKWVLKDNQWISKNVIEAADVLVTQEFVVNPDCCNNTFIWHSDNNVKDNYYKHLFPLNEKQYKTALAYYDRFHVCTDDTILKLMNKRRYMPTWMKNKYMRPTVQGVGYAGCCDRDSYAPSYRVWVHMLERCYSNYDNSYSDCTVCLEWLNYSNFRMWYDTHFYQAADTVMNLDKDILIPGNRIYSPAACAFVPSRVNEAAHTGKKKSGLPTGVFKNESTGKYYTSQDRKYEFDSVEDALLHYKKYKERCLIQLADEMSGKISRVICDALKVWAVG